MDQSLSGWRTRVYAELNQPLATVLGARTAREFEQLRIRTVGDLLRHIPRRYLSGTELTDLSTVVEGDHVAVVARVLNTVRREAPRGRPGRLEAVLSDGRNRLNVTFFGAEHLLRWWDDQLSKGVSGIFVGKVGSFRNELQMTHPEFVMLDAEGHIVGTSEAKQRMATLSRSGLVGVYPATAKLQTWKVAECARLALQALSGTEDPWPSWVREQAGVVELTTAFANVHRPMSLDEAERGAHRLRFDEALATQLTMAHRRALSSARVAVPRVRVSGGLLDAFDGRLPFQLTDGQRQVCATLFEELAREHPMHRLLQGEVGSGKTVVALRAMLAVADAGGQSALLAPTEVLAGQHYQTIRALLGDLGAGRLLGSPDTATDVVLLTGSMPAAAKREALLRVASGDAGIVVGTHALLSERVQFADLGLVVVDEQHRFGVEQRAALADKAATRPHVLVLTATPIPRSVAMTIFGDLDVSTLKEIPSGRQDVSTVVVDGRLRPGWVERAWQRVVEEVSAGRQAFIVCPRIGGQGNPAEQGMGVVELAAQLSEGPLAGLRLGSLHGQLPTDAKDAAMAAFAAGELDVLVATTVIEVGVDVPNASMMVVWDADRFGISQLHQLRGRIGRGEHPGVCLLVTHAQDDVARARLEAVAATRDGFELAELDLEQRREGDVLGANQSGTRSSLRLLRVLEHADLIVAARELALECLRRDPSLTTPGFADAVRQTELMADGDWMERS